MIPTNENPIFDFNVTDWEYHALITGIIECPFGDIDAMFMIYKDEHYQLKGRMKFPSGTKFVVHYECSSLNDAIDKAHKVFNFLPETNNVKVLCLNTIYNPSLKGCDMFDIITKSGLFDNEYTVVKNDTN